MVQTKTIVTSWNAQPPKIVPGGGNVRVPSSVCAVVPVMEVIREETPTDALRRKRQGAPASARDAKFRVRSAIAIFVFVVV